MEAKREREFLLKDHRSIKGAALLKKFGFFEKVFILFFDMVCSITKKLYSSQNKHSNTIAIIVLHRLGDSVFTIPAIREIFNHYAGHKIFIICYPETKSIYEITFPANSLIEIQRSEFKISRRFATKAARNILKKINPSIVFDLTGTPSSASLIWYLRANEKIGLNVRYLKNLYNAFTPIRKHPHFMDIYMDVVKLKVPIPNEAQLYRFESKINRNGNILVHPFAIINPKEWKLNRFLELGAILLNYYDVEMVSPPGFLEEDIITELNKMNISCSYTETVKSLIQKIKECSVFISNDSGPTYIASLLGKPTFSIYGPTNPRFSFPFGENHRYIQKHLKCTAVDEKICFTRGGIDCPTNECMNTLTTEKVADSVMQFLEELGIEKKNYASQ